MKFLNLVFFLFLFSCRTYNKIDNISLRRENCKEFFSKDNNLLNGYYTINLGKGFFRSGVFVEGKPVKLHTVKKNSRIDRKYNYDKFGNIISYSYYNNNNSNNEYDDYYSIQKFDSLVTMFNKDEIKESTYYLKTKFYKVEYESSEKGIDIVTNIPKYDISISQTPSIPLNYLLNDCKTNTLKDTLYINIKSAYKITHKKLFLNGNSILNYEEVR